MIIWERALSCTLPVSVFFLTLDRCLMLHFGLNYQSAYANSLCVCSILITILASSVTLFIYIAPKFMPEDESWAACYDTVCFFRQADDWQFLVRVTFGTMNFLCSLVFFSLLRREQAKRFLFTADTTFKTAVS